jgi:hypothetical protein
MSGAYDNMPFRQSMDEWAASDILNPQIITNNHSYRIKV